jgi:hypothetical protein
VQRSGFVTCAVRDEDAKHGVVDVAPWLALLEEILKLTSVSSPLDRGRRFAV